VRLALARFRVEAGAVENLTHVAAVDGLGAFEESGLVVTDVDPELVAERCDEFPTLEDRRE
jgi:hypothetical protein